MNAHVWIALVAITVASRAGAQAAPDAMPRDPDAGIDAENAEAEATDDLDDAPVDDVADAVPFVASPVGTAGSVGALFDSGAEEVYRRCAALLAREREPEARTCFLRLVVQARGSEGALKAEVALFVLDAQLTAPTTTASDALIPPGRLGITAAAGLFGAWNAIGAGIMLGATTNGGIPGATLIIGTSGAAIAGGVAMGAGGYFLADHLKLDEGAARLVASSLVWGDGDRPRSRARRRHPVRREQRAARGEPGRHHRARRRLRGRGRRVHSGGQHRI